MKLEIVKIGRATVQYPMELCKLRKMFYYVLRFGSSGTGFYFIEIL